MAIHAIDNLVIDFARIVFFFWQKFLVYPVNTLNLTSQQIPIAMLKNSGCVVLWWFPLKVLDCSPFVLMIPDKKILVFLS